MWVPPTSMPRIMETPLAWGGGLEEFGKQNPETEKAKGLVPLALCPAPFACPCNISRCRRQFILRLFIVPVLRYKGANGPESNRRQ